MPKAFGRRECNFFGGRDRQISLREKESRGSRYQIECIVEFSVYRLAEWNYFFRDTFQTWIATVSNFLVISRNHFVEICIFLRPEKPCYCQSCTPILFMLAWFRKKAPVEMYNATRKFCSCTCANAEKNSFAHCGTGGGARSKFSLQAARLLWKAGDDQFWPIFCSDCTQITAVAGSRVWKWFRYGFVTAMSSSQTWLETESLKSNPNCLSEILLSVRRFVEKSFVFKVCFDQLKARTWVYYR